MTRATFFLTLMACFGTIDAAIVTRPSDALVRAGSRAVFNCSSDLEPPMNWWHTPVGSIDSIEFYFLKGFPDYAEFYASSCRVDISRNNQYNLIIESVTAQHAGRYDCYDAEGAKAVHASAELTVIESVPTCDYVVNVDSTETEITCNLSMVGNLEPKLLCQNGWDKSSDSIFSTRDRNGVPGKYLSTNVSLSNSTDETHFACSFLRDYTSQHLIVVHVRVDHKTFRLETTSSVTTAETEGRTLEINGRADCETSVILKTSTIVVSAVLVAIIILNLSAFIYKFREVRRSNQRRDTPEFFVRIRQPILKASRV